MTMHMDSARSEPTHYNTVQFGDQITVTEITTFGSSFRGSLTFTGGLSVERSGRVADDSLNARDTLGRNKSVPVDTAPLQSTVRARPLLGLPPSF